MTACVSRSSLPGAAQRGARWPSPLGPREDQTSRRSAPQLTRSGSKWGEGQEQESIHTVLRSSDLQPTPTTLPVPVYTAFTPSHTAVKVRTRRPNHSSLTMARPPQRQTNKATDPRQRANEQRQRAARRAAAMAAWNSQQALAQRQAAHRATIAQQVAARTSRLQALLNARAQQPQVQQAQGAIPAAPNAGVSVNAPNSPWYNVSFVLRQEHHTHSLTLALLFACRY